MLPSPLTMMTPRSGRASPRPKPSPVACPMAEGMYAKSSGVSDNSGQTPTADIVVMTTLSPRTSANTSRAWRCVMGMALLRDQDSGGALLRLRLAIVLGDVGGGMPAIQERVRHAPGLQDRLGEDRAGIAA